MILRHPLLEKLPFLFALLAANLLQARAEFDCKPKLNGKLWDFTGLSKEYRQVNRTRSTPPSETIDSLTFDLCEDLVPDKDLPAGDRCPDETRACLTQINVKNDTERIISVIPLALSNLKSEINVWPDIPVHLSIVLQGEDYPKGTKPSQPQSLNLTMWCEPENETSLNLISYDGSRLALEYHGKAGCPAKSDGGDETPGDGDGKDPDQGKEETGSGIGWFFFMLLLAFMAYFGIGAYYNYSTYGARGLDLIPGAIYAQRCCFASMLFGKAAQQNIAEWLHPSVSGGCVGCWILSDAIECAFTLGIVHDFNDDTVQLEVNFSLLLQQAFAAMSLLVSLVELSYYLSWKFPLVGFQTCRC